MKCSLKKRRKSAKAWTFWNQSVHLSSMEPEPCIDNDEIAYKCANIWYVFVTIFLSKSTITSCPTWIEDGLHGRIAQRDADHQLSIHHPPPTIHLDKGWSAWSDGTMRNTQEEVEGTRFSLRLFEPGGFVFIKQSLISGIFWEILCCSFWLTEGWSNIPFIVWSSIIRVS